MSFNSFSKTFSFNVYLLSLALLKPAAPVRIPLGSFSRLVSRVDFITTYCKKKFTYFIL